MKKTSLAENSRILVKQMKKPRPPSQHSKLNRITDEVVFNLFKGFYRACLRT